MRLGIAGLAAVVWIVISGLSLGQGVGPADPSGRTDVSAGSSAAGAPLAARPDRSAARERRCPTTRARCGATMTLARTQRGVTLTNRPSKPSSIGSRNTGYEIWHADPVSVLIAAPERCTFITRPRCRSA